MSPTWQSAPWRASNLSHNCKLSRTNSARRQRQFDKYPHVGRFQRHGTKRTRHHQKVGSVGFSGEEKSTLGEITFPTYAQGVNIQVKFLVIDCLSSYNIIVGMPWIHDMKVIPSTYHQTIKFPTKQGVPERKGYHKLAKECFATTLKPSVTNKMSA